jgi:hypothetical protein
MDELRPYTSLMKHELAKSILSEATLNVRPELSLKNAFEHSFWESIKMNFSSQREASQIFSAIAIPTQLMESKFDAEKYENGLPSISRLNQLHRSLHRRGICIERLVGSSGAPLRSSDAMRGSALMAHR